MINNPAKQLPIINVTCCQSDTQLDQYSVAVFGFTGMALGGIK